MDVPAHGRHPARHVDLVANRRGRRGGALGRDRPLHRPAVGDRVVLRALRRPRRAEDVQLGRGRRGVAVIATERHHRLRRPGVRRRIVRFEALGCWRCRCSCQSRTRDRRPSRHSVPDARRSASAPAAASCHCLRRPRDRRVRPPRPRPCRPARPPRHRRLRGRQHRRPRPPHRRPAPPTAVPPLPATPVVPAAPAEPPVPPVPAGAALPPVPPGTADIRRGAAGTDAATRAATRAGRAAAVRAPTVTGPEQQRQRTEPSDL